MGRNAIQLAVTAGYQVISTASPKNFEYVKKLGVSEVFDYKCVSVGDDLVNTLSGKTIAGVFDSIRGPAWSIYIDVAYKSTGTKFVSTTKCGFPDPPEDITIKQVFGTTIKDDLVSKAVYKDFLPRALKAGVFIPAPEPLIAGKGLDSIRGAVDLYETGVSARKVVVSQ